MHLHIKNKSGAQETSSHTTQMLNPANTHGQSILLLAYLDELFLAVSNEILVKSVHPHAHNALRWWLMSGDNVRPPPSSSKRSGRNCLMGTPLIDGRVPLAPLSVSGFPPLSAAPALPTSPCCVPSHAQIWGDGLCFEVCLGSPFLTVPCVCTFSKDCTHIGDGVFIRRPFQCHHSISRSVLKPTLLRMST